MYKRTNLRSGLLGEGDSRRSCYAVASGCLYLVSLLAVGFGFWVARHRHPRKGLQLAFIAFLFFAFFAWVFEDQFAFKMLRPLLVEHILAGANNLVPPLNRFAIGDADACFFNQFVRFVFPDVDQFHVPSITGLVRLNALIGLTAVGMLLAALASISILQGKDAKIEDLHERRKTIRVVLGLGAALLVISVIASKIVVEWPASLLSNLQQKAIAPVEQAQNLMFAASCTIVLIAALSPALIAFVLDRQAFREVYPGTRQEATSEPAESRARTKSIKTPEFADGLDFALLPTMSAAMAAFSPLLASPVLELVVSIFKMSHF